MMFQCLTNMTETGNNNGIKNYNIECYSLIGSLAHNVPFSPCT